MLPTVDCIKVMLLIFVETSRKCKDDSWYLSVTETMVQSNHNPTALSSMMSIYIISRIYPDSKDTVWVNYHPTDTLCAFLAVDVGICEAEEELDRPTDILTLVSNRTTSQNYACYYSVFMARHRSVQSSFPSVPLNLYLSSSFLSRSLRGAWCPAWQQMELWGFGTMHTHTQKDRKMATVGRG